MIYARIADMISFKFNETKTTQVAAFFIEKHGNVLNYTKLIKLLYLADREALSVWGRSLSGDSYFSLPKGPILSKTYDLINYKEDPNNKSYWYKFISKMSYDVMLIGQPGIDELSEREIDLIHKIYEKYKGKDWGEMIDVCHECCPEWQDPGETSIPIPIENILREFKKTEKEIDLIDEEASNLKYFDSIMPSV